MEHLLFTGTSVETVSATDADTGINAVLVYRIEKGGFEDFAIDNKTGVISVASKLDYDLRNSYNIHVIAVDGGMLCYNFNPLVYRL